MIVEERDGDVTLTLRLTTRISFSPIERERPITASDFIDNAIGCLYPSIIKEIEGGGFHVALPIEGEVDET